MLTPQQLQNLPKALTDSYSELAEFVLRDIARRIAKGAEITDTAEYQLYRARALGLSTKEITDKIAEINGVSAGTIEQLIRDAAAKSDEFDRRMLGADNGAAIPLPENEQLQKIMAAEIKQTYGACENYTRTLGFAEKNADGQVIYSSLQDFLHKEMDAAHMKVVNGVTDYNTALRQACEKLAASGVRTVYYNSGHSDRIEVAVRRALMTSVSQVTQRVSEQNAELFGADGWEISAHSGARPSHAVYQGRQYPNSEYDTIVKPLIEDYNCRHSAYPIIMGISTPAYTEEELKNIDPPPFTYEGKTYTAYEAQQQMRKMERAMRKQKDCCIAADAAGDKESFTTASIKLRRQKDIYEDFCKAAGTYTEYERTFVAGYNRHLSGKTGAVTRKQRAFDKAQLRLTDAGNGGIIKEKEYKSFSSGQEANDFFYYDDSDHKGLLAKKKSQYGQWYKSLTADEFDSTYWYTSEGYGDINCYFRRKSGWESINAKKVKDASTNIDNMISRFILKDNITVQRGAMEDALDDLIGRYGVNDLSELVGKIYHDDGYMSTTALIGNSVATFKPVVFEIQVPSGIGRGAYINEISGFTDTEYEFLIKRGSDFTITEVTEDKTLGKVHIRMVMNVE